MATILPNQTIFFNLKTNPMKMKKTLQLLFFLIFIAKTIYSQSPNDVLNLLTQRKLISQEEADSLRADAAIKQQESDAKQKSFLVNAGKSIQLAGYTQVRYQNLDEPGKIDGFDIRRARLDIKGNISPYFGYRLQTGFANSVKLLDAYAELRLTDYLNVTIGQQKVPFSLENLASSNKLESIDRSQVVEALVARGKDVIGNQNGRDIGVQIGGAIVKLNDRALIDYRIGIFNGGGINAGDNNEDKDVVARLVFHPIAGLDLGGGYYNGVGFYGSPNAESSGRTRWGLELSYVLKNLSLRSEYIQGKDGSIDRFGYYAQAGYYIWPQKLQLLAKYDWYDPDKAKTDNATTWYTAGLTFNFNPNVRIQAGYTIKEEQGPNINNNMGVVQFQMGF